MTTVAFPHAPSSPAVGHVAQRLYARVRLAWPLPSRITIFLALALLYGALSVYLLSIGWPLPNDAVSRIALASFVVFGRDPHLAAVGFVWNPLPSLAEIPFLLALRPLGMPLLAGPLQSSLAMAGAATLIGLICRLHGLSRRLSFALTLLFAFNPMILLYAVNGMSEAQLIFFLVATVWVFSIYVQRGGIVSLLALGLIGAGGFTARYESIAVIAAATLGVVCAFLAGESPDPPRLEATLLAYLLPISYAIFLWLFANALIMGDALFFVRGPYSNAAQAAASDLRNPSNPLSQVIGSIPGTLAYALTRSEANCLAFVGILSVAGVMVARRRDWYLASIAAIGVSVLAFETLLLFGGSSFGWFRFFIYSIPASFFLVPPLLSAFTVRRARLFVTGTLLALLVVSDAVCGWATTQPSLTPEASLDTQTLPFFGGPVNQSPALVEERGIAAYVDQQLPDQTILVDTFLGAGIPLLAHDPTQFIITNDRDFAAKLTSLAASANYVLVPAPTGLGGVDLVNGTYPGLYLGEVPWATLVQEFPGPTHWRLFQITRRVGT